MMRKGSISVFLLISFGLLGGSAQAALPSVDSLIGKRYKSVRVVGNSLIKDRQIRVVFSGSSANPQLTVRGGCNAWRAGYRIVKGRLALKGPASGTDLGCSRNPDPWLRSKFRKGLTVRARSSGLTLTRPNERVRFEFKLVSPKRDSIDENPGSDPTPRVTVPATKQDVDGNSYELIDTIGKELDRGLRLGFRDGFKTDGDGDPVPVSSFGFYAGCNHLGGEYGIEDGVLTWTDVDTTDMWCQESDDEWLFDFFSDGPQIGLDGTDLVLRKNGVELVLEEVAHDPIPRITVPATMEDVLGKSYEAVSVIGPKLDRTLKIGFFMGTRGSPGNLVTGPTFGFYAGCNHFGGWADVEDGVLSWTEVIQTLMLCEGSPDKWLTPFFKKNPEIGLDGTDLVIRNKGVEIVFREVSSN